VLAVALLLPLLGAAPAVPPARSDPPAAPAGDSSIDHQRAEIADQMIRLGARIQHEVEAVNVAALVARVPADGLRCGGQVVPRSRVEHDLRSEGSWLHGVFFGGPGAPAPRGQPASLKAFFATAREIAVLVQFRADPRSAVGVPCLDFRAKGTVTPGAPLCFESRAGQWWFTESLYPCQ